MNNAPKKPAPARKKKPTFEQSAAQKGIKVRYYPRSFLWNVLAVTVAFLFGIFAAVGGFLGGSYFVTTKVKLGDLLKNVPSYEEYVGQDLLDDSMLDVVNSLLTDLKDPKALTLADLEKYSPAIRTKLMGDLAAQAEEIGVTLDIDALMQQPLGSMIVYLRDDVAKNIAIGPILTKFSNEAPDELVLTICYGNKGTDWDYDEDGNIQMLEGKTPLTVGDIGNIKERLFSIELQAVLSDAQDPIVQSLFNFTETDEEGNTNTRPTTLQDLMNSATEIIKGVELSVILKDSSDPLLYSLCYGNEGEGWEYDAEGKPQPIEGVPARTLGALLSGNGATELIKGIQLSAVLTGNLTDPLLLSLCYGTEGTDWEYDEQGKIQMIGDAAPTTFGDLMSENGISDALNKMELSAVLLKNSTDPLLYSLCYGNEGEGWEYNEEGKPQPIEGASSTTFGDLLTGTGATDLIKGIQLSAVIGKTDDALLLSLCYGNEGTDWQYDDAGNIEMIDPAKPTTFGDLMDSESGGITAIMKKVPLSTVVGNTKDPIMLSLCYGNDYTLNEDGTVTLPEGVAPKTLGDFMSGAQGLVQDLQVETILGITADSSSALRYLAYGPELTKTEDGSYDKTVESDGNGGWQYVGGGRYTVKDGKIVMQPIPTSASSFEGTYAKKTVKDLTAAENDMIGGAKLGDLITINDDTSAFMKTLKDWTIADLQNQEKIEGLSIGQLLGEADSGVLGAIAGKTIKQLQSDTGLDDVQLGALLGNPEGGVLGALAKHELTIGKLKEEGSLNEIGIGELLGNPTEGVLGAIAKKGLTIGQLQEKDCLNNFTIGELFDNPKEGVLGAIADKTIEQLQSDTGLDDIKIGELLGLDNNTKGLMGAIKDWRISDFKQQARIERLKISQIISIGPDPSPLIKAIKDWRISDLTDKEKIESLTLSSLLTINQDSPAMLQALQNMSLGELGKDIDKLTLQDVLGSESFEGNAILKSLRYTQIGELGNAISNLTVADVFGADMWKYKLTSEGDGTRPENSYSASDVTSKYFYNDTTEVVKGYYTGSEGSWTKVEDEALVKYQGERAYIETEKTVTQAVSYYKINYENILDKSQTYDGGDVKTDDFSAYYMDGETRVDLGEIYTYSYQEGGPVAESAHILQREDGSFYVIEQTDVSVRYAPKNGAPQTTYTDNVTEKYYNEEGQEVVPYLSGVWYLLLSKEDGSTDTNTKITELAKQVTGVAEKINSITLHEMYVHELINGTDPGTIDISTFKYKKGDGPDIYQALGELSIPQVLDLVNWVKTPSNWVDSSLLPGLGGLGG